MIIYVATDSVLIAFMRRDLFGQTFAMCHVLIGCSCFGTLRAKRTII